MAKISYKKVTKRRIKKSINKWINANAKVVGAKVFKNSGKGKYLIKVVNKAKSLYYKTYADFKNNRNAVKYTR